MLSYKQAWRGATIMIAERWYPSSRLCQARGAIRSGLTLSDRVFTCGCGHSADRDCNAAINLARWGEIHHLDPRPPSNGAGPSMPADGTALTSTHACW
jgi:putative transposase